MKNYLELWYQSHLDIILSTTDKVERSSHLRYLINEIKKDNLPKGKERKLIKYIKEEL